MYPMHMIKFCLLKPVALWRCVMGFCSILLVFVKNPSKYLTLRLTWATQKRTDFAENRHTIERFNSNINNINATLAFVHSCIQFKRILAHGFRFVCIDIWHMKSRISNILFGSTVRLYNVSMIPRTIRIAIIYHEIYILHIHAYWLFM